jgi:hypothetical protein
MGKLQAEAESWRNKSRMKRPAGVVGEVHRMGGILRQVDAEPDRLAG